jgi:glycosyltransferase involved in cell wall biosynthesis
MRVLVVTAHPILPLTHGGRVRTMGLASGLVRAGVTVDLLCPWAPSEPWRPFVHDGVTCVPHRFATNALRLLPNRVLPPVVALSWQPFSLGPRRRLASAATYDVIQFEFCTYAAWMERLAGSAKVVYSAHNVEQDQHRGEAAAAPLVRPWGGRVAALERRAVRASDLVMACTEFDASRLAALYGDRPAFTVVPNGFDDALIRGDRPTIRQRMRNSLGIPADATALVFVGGRARHNQEALEFLERRVMPRLGAEARLLVAGACAGEVPPSGDPSVLRLGYVDDLGAVLAAADVAVNPVSYGSGSNLKMADYLAAGLPVVSTSIGARGFERHGQSVRVAELDAFADAVIEISATPGRFRANVDDVDELSWTRIGQRVEGIYRGLLGR